MAVGVKVAGRFVLTTGDFIAVTNAVAVSIGEAVSVTIESVSGKRARAIVVGGCGVKVAGRFVLTTGDFIAVTDFVAVSVGEAVSVTIEGIAAIEVNREFARPIIFGSQFIIVAGSVVRAPRCGASCSEIETYRGTQSCHLH